jgi:hypothetical protein
MGRAFDRLALKSAGTAQTAEDDGRQEAAKKRTEAALKVEGDEAADPEARDQTLPRICATSEIERS